MYLRRFGRLCGKLFRPTAGVSNAFRTRMGIIRRIVAKLNYKKYYEINMQKD